MDTTRQRLAVATYNCQHFSECKLHYLKSLLEDNCIIFVQEHCLLQSQFADFYKLGDISYHAVSAMDDTQPLYGRPFGGCGIIWKNSLKVKFSPIQCRSKRICGGIMNLDSIKLLLINTYLPCDERYQSFSFHESVDVLNEIASLVLEHATDAVVVAGDFNSDLTRSTPQVRALKDFIEAVQLGNGLDSSCALVDFTFESKANNATSLIDHILISQNCFESILEYKSIKSVDNMSDHDAVSCTLDLNVTIMKKVDRTFQHKAAWHKASRDNIVEYQNNLDTRLSNMCIPNDLMICDNVSCGAHKEDIIMLLSNIIDACLSAEQSSIPKIGRSARRVPGWTDFVEEKRRDALHWHHEWISLSRPRHGDIYEKMKVARKEYHKSIRFCKRNNAVIQSQKMAEAIMSNNSRNFWDEVNRINKSTKSVPSYVDGEGDSGGIANIFHGRFSEVYRGVPYEECDMLQLHNRINSKLLHDFQSLQRHGFCALDFKQTIQKLKSGKADGYIGLNSACIVNGTERLFTLLALFFRIILVHGFVPDDLLLGTMSPIPKNKCLQSSDNYRAITLISSILKLFDYNILLKFEKVFQTDSLQLGFKEKCSTALCTSMMIETARNFTSNKSRVHAVLLDASKAFDRIEFTRLFNILLDKQFNSVYVRCLLYMYTNQRLRINWNGVYSETFYVTNGVKQGGVLSPVLFGLYLDRLIDILRQSGNGCYIGPHFVGCLAYADDLVLMSPTKQSLLKMLDMCNQFSVDYKLKFNGTKSQYIVFDQKVNPGEHSIQVFDVILHNQDYVNHLGHKVQAAVSKINLDGIIASFYKQFNFFRSRFSRVASSIQARLFQTYCSSFYGAVLEPLQLLPRLHVAWRKALRVVWNLPYRTHCGILASLSKGLCEKHMFMSRFAGFASNALNHNSDVISFVMRNSLTVSMSPFRQNVEYLCRQLDLPTDVMMRKNPMKSTIVNLCKKCKADIDVLKAGTIKELSDVRDQLSSCILNLDEINFMIDYLCLM